MLHMDLKTWQEYAVPLAKTDNLVMTAIALLYSSHMNLTGTGRFAQLYHDHFANLLAIREKKHIFSADENLLSLVALLVVLLSQVAGPELMFLQTECKLLEMLVRLDLSPDASNADHTAIRQWIFAEIGLMKDVRENSLVGYRVGPVEWLTES
ncbi:hypothetical protein FAGAP_6051 [Fusarium agapanthi]|uniref:Transcription factor domain-containing protein n=1 Tax=Fusarium agapanthi TaxID=1803897 RepID=A0A9P5EED2_9HYPO|nr:hypothetical protein FAGAP_6051 [Fusarium agapanthi]